MTPVVRATKLTACQSLGIITLLGAESAAATTHRHARVARHPRRSRAIGTGRHRTCDNANAIPGSGCANNF